jgi:molybdate transport system substrate-binding protein
VGNRFYAISGDVHNSRNSKGAKIMNITLRAALFAACIPAFAAAQDTDIHILCSNGIRGAMEKLLPQYEHSMGRPIKVKFGPSANFKQAIQGGEQFDLAILTPQIIEDLIKEGKMAAGSHADIATTGVGFAVRAGAPKPDVSTPEAIKQTLLKAKSIGYVKIGAGTPAIMAMLNTLGINDQVQNKVVFQPGAEQSMASVAGGQTEVAIALVSEILSVPGVQLAGPFPPQFQKPVVMAAGISSSTKNRDVADKIVKSLKSAAAAPTIKAAGLDPVQ